MKQFLGIDIGSTSSSIVIVDSDCNLLFHDYCFHSGRVIECLKEQLAKTDVSKLSGIGYTSSTPSIIRSGIKLDSRVSFIKAARHFYSNPEAMLIIGGEKFGLVRFDEKGEYQNYKSNTSCAAGTGNFLDQQVNRLNLENISSLSELAIGNKGRFPKIASRCSVFAKTDLIHAQQEGYSLAEICDGLCYGLAKNVVDAVLNNSGFNRLIIAGGVSLNMGVLKHIRAITGTELLIHEYSHLFGAFGAAIALQEELPDGALNIKSLKNLISEENKPKKYFNLPLKLKLSDYPDFSGLEDYEFKASGAVELKPVEVSLYHELVENKESGVFLGIDIGSTSTKAVILNYKKQVIAGFYTRTSGRPLRAVQALFEAIEELGTRKNHRFNVRAAGTTGSGRKFIARIIDADAEPDEITAHARAAVELDPETDTIIEIGGQDSKFTLLNNGIVTLSVMNNVCAAGTGSFIEEQARKLDCPLDDYSERAMQASSPMSSDRCTVFMERDLNHFLNEGYSKDELLASVLHSIRENYLSKVAIKASIGKKIFFQGATAKNEALVAAFEQKLEKPIMVSKYCHLTGALGVALELHDKQILKSKFRGLDLWKKHIPVRSEVCEICTNHCKLKLAEIEGITEAYGFLCGRDYQTEKFVKADSQGFDLIKKYKKHFSLIPESIDSEIVIGLPSALHIADDMLLWQKFFDLLKIKTINSENCKDPVKKGKKIAEAEFCAPISAAYGHVDFLKDKVSHIFLPVYLEKGSNVNTSKHYCYYTQYLPSIIKNTENLAGNIHFLSPMVNSLKSESYTISELVKMIEQVGIKGIGSRQIGAAYRDAKLFFSEKQDQWKELYLKEKDDDNLNILILGRPYTVLSPSMNNNIPEIISKFGYKAFFMDMIPGEDAKEDVQSPLVKTIFWKYASKILDVAEKAAKTKMLYPVLITSFKCTPDSFVIEYFKEIMDFHKKPYLVLQLDEHDSTVGYETRIEAAIRSFQNHLKKQTSKEPVYAENKVSVKLHNRFLPPEITDILTDHEIDPGNLSDNGPEILPDHDLSHLKTGQTDRLKGKTILFPGWDIYAGKLIEAFLVNEGWKIGVIYDTEQSIRQSLNLNSGQCLPLNVIAQNACDYIEKNKLDPAEVVIWVPRGFLSCNLMMFPHYLRKILKRINESYEEIEVYPGNLGFYDFSVKTGMNIFLAYLFAGSLRKIACKIRPYEKEKDLTDRISMEALNLLYNAILHNEPKAPVLKKIMDMFDRIPISKSNKPKVAIFGDMYVRDNDVFNQDLVKVIEENGGEVIPTSYSEYIKIIVKQTELRYIEEGRYREGYYLRYLKYLIPLLENKYTKYFEKYIKNIDPLNGELFNILERHHLHLLQRGESVDNILKIENLVKNYNISLFVQTSPSYCCPSLITEAMSSHIEKTTGIPVVSIEYDGTFGGKNEDVIPYLKLRNEKEKLPPGFRK